MESARTYNIFGPDAALRRMITQLFESFEPKYNFKYSSPDHNDTVQIVVYEQYEQRIDASITLSCMTVYTGKKLQINLIKTGGRTGFRGSSLTNKQRTIDDDIIDFIDDFGKRHGLAVKKQVPEKPSKDNDDEKKA